MARTETVPEKKKRKRSRQKKIQYFDYGLLFIVIFLMGFGFVMLYSTSAYTATLKYGDGAHYLKRQMFSAAIGFFAMFICTKMEYHQFKKMAKPLYVVSLFLCTAVIFVGSSTNGSSRWLKFHGLSVQPSEIAKVAVILLLASAISNAPRKMRSRKNIVKLFILIFPIFAIVAYTNLSTAVIILGIAFVLAFVANPSYRLFAVLGAAAMGAIFLFIQFAGYRSSRIEVWKHPENYEKGYQTLQGLYAIGSGGLFGKGLGESTQKLGFVPEAQNDMIFSIICEELGLFGAVCVIIMFLLLLWRLLFIANHAKDMFGSYVAIGILTHLALQVIFNIAVVTNTVPNTGITLPFISYGGTSLLILLTEIGIALSVSKGIELDE